MYIDLERQYTKERYSQILDETQQIAEHELSLTIKDGSSDIWISIISQIKDIREKIVVGTDYFVGEQGFAVVNFVDSRTNITSKKIILFKDLSYLFTGETIKKMNYSYAGTDYYFALYKKLNSDGEHYDLAYNAIGSYSDKNPEDTMNPKGASEEYCMLKKVEQVWTLFFFESHKFDRELTFPMFKDNVIFSDALILNNNGVCVDGVRYNRENTKRIYFSNGQLVIEHQNHSKQFFGLVEHGDISGIPLSELGNRRAFLMLFDKIYKS